MGDSILILTPLLVLAVVLLLAFAGCSFEHGVLSSTLTFRARVPTDLTVVGGVTFTWRRPTATIDETTTLTSITSGPSLQRYIDAALNLGPPAFLWTLGNVDGLQDRTGKGRDGTAAGGVTVGGVQDGPTEFFDATATQFDGADDRITSPHDPVFMGTVGRTFVGFARRHTSTTNDVLFGSSAGATADQARLLLAAGQDVRFEPNGSDGQTIVWTNAWPGNAQWVWWALRFDQAADNVSLFINGQLVSTQNCTDTWPAAPGNFQVGAAGTSSAPFDGDLALIAVYEDLLTDPELVGLYEASQETGYDLYEYPIPSQVAGTWHGRCAMTVQADGQLAPGDSGDFSFTVENGKRYVLVFQADGSPLGPTPFGITPGLVEV